MDKTILTNYQTFVDGVTSDVSKDDELYIARIRELSALGVQVARLTTASIGMVSEGGEFDEVVKKILFHGKEYNDENLMKMKKELGDVIWYWMNACTALGFDPNEIIEENVRKLESRYPGGKFSVWHAENRAAEDI